MSTNPIRKLFMALMNIKHWLDLDLMEYSSDAAAQAAYVTDATTYTEVVDQQQTAANINAIALGDGGVGSERRPGQGFQLSGTKTVTAIEIKRGTNTGGTPAGNWTIRIETNNGSNVPSGTLADINASIVVTPPAEETIIKGTFATPFSLNASTTYWIVVECDNQPDNTYWQMRGGSATSYVDGSLVEKINSVWQDAGNYDIYFKIYVQDQKVLQSYSESTIKQQGSYSLKGIAVITDSLNKTLTHTFASPLDLSGVNTLKLDMRSTRTGANVKCRLQNTVVVDQSISEAGQDAGEGLRYEAQNVDAVGQVFVPTKTGDLTSCKFYLKKQGTPTGNIWVKLTALDGNHVPTGSVLAQSSNVDVSTLSTSYGLITFTFPTPYINIAGTEYGIYIEGDFAYSTSNFMWVGKDNSTPSYSYYEIIKEAGWTYKSGQQFACIFYTYVKPTTELTPTINTVGEFETKSLDISGVTDADKNAIDKLIFTVVNADEANTVYIDNFGGR